MYYTCKAKYRIIDFSVMNMNKKKYQTLEILAMRFWNGGDGRLPRGPYFFFFSYLFVLPLFFPFFLKMPYYPYFFTLKCHLCGKNPEFFPRSLCSLRFINSLLYFLRNRPLYISNFKFLTKYVSLFHSYDCHCYYHAYLVWTFLFYVFLTTHWN